MFNGLRRLKISLAAKCQLLFGAAVVLIIIAALLVPWQRMEQLMEKINERAAATLADSAVDQHVLQQSALPKNIPASLPVIVATTTQPATIDGRIFAAPHLVSIQRTDALTRFEKAAIKRFAEQPELTFVAHSSDAKDGTQRYAYVRPLYAQNASCVKCHSQGEASASTLPATSQARAAKLMGVLSVDIESQIQTNQLLLNRVFMLLAGLLIGVIATAVFYLITTRLILQPVRVLQETAEKVSEGDLNIRSDISSGDEFQQLSETFNTMLTNLQEHEDQLRQINKSLDLKLGQMAESNVALYESNRLKSEFLANVSHELRTPLNSILGFAELLRDTPGEADAKTIRYTQNIINSGRNLLDLINDLLDLAKIEAGKMEVRSEPLSLNDLFEGLVSILKPLSEAKSLTIDATTAADVPVLRTDAPKLQQILYNFLSNAIKFSPNGAKIELSATRQDEQSIRIVVTDAGPGIDAQKHQVIFEKFRQLDGSVTREHSGTGLGLAISKELAALLGGTIGVQSTLGQGATFWLLLPTHTPASTQDVRANVVLA